ncbi:MAG: ZIP family metal transporter, partial [Clostridia bacterium]|nr:ZIP family metal transporter [Clostridia bacterium]
PHRWHDGIMGFAAGIMLAAAVMGLILPAVEMTGVSGVWQVVVGVFAGAIFLHSMDRLTPHLHKLSGVDSESHTGNESLNKILLFVLAIAIHNLPEGLAAGVGFGGEDIGGAISVAVGIALQNVPEGMVIISPMLLAGMSKGRTFFLAAMTGVVEVIGTFVGFFAASVSGAILPFVLAFAGGTMLYVISDEMIPETHSHGYEHLATYALLTGFVVMLLMDVVLA